MRIGILNIELIYGKKSNLIKTIVLCFALLITFARLFIQMRLPDLISANQTVDDALMQGLAMHLYSGEYLGEYGEFTLCKDYAYSLMLALCYKLLIPYSLFVSVLNIGSAVAFCQSVKKYVSFFPRVVIYTLLIYSPVTFSDLTALRIYRNSVISYMTLFVFAGFIAFFLYKDEKSIKKLIPWAILECICLPIFWYIKEDSIWILPFIVVITLISCVYVFAKDKTNGLKKVIVYSCPFIALVFVSVVVMTINYCNYGIFTTNDRSHTEASKTYSNILSVEDTSQHQDCVWVSQETLDKIAQVSPSFAIINSKMKESDVYTEDGEVKGDLYIWKIRHIMQELGYYDDAKKANEWYKSINQEIGEAFENGLLQEDELIHLSGQMKGLTIDEICSFVPKSITNLYDVSVYKRLILSLMPSSGSMKDITTQQVLLGSNAFLGNSDEYSWQSQAGGYQCHLADRINKGIRVYQKAGGVIDILALVGFGIYTICMIYNMIKRNYSHLNMFVVMCGIILSAFVVSLEVELFTSWFEESMYEGFIAFYSVALYPLVSVFKYLSIVLGINAIIEMVRNRRTKTNNKLYS